MANRRCTCGDGCENARTSSATADQVRPQAGTSGVPRTTADVQDRLAAARFPVAGLLMDTFLFLLPDGVESARLARRRPTRD